MRIMSVDRVDGSWGVIDSNGFNLFTRSLRKVFRKERIHLLGMRCRGKPGTGFAIEDFQPLEVKRAIENGRRNRIRHLNSP